MSSASASASASTGTESTLVPEWVQVWLKIPFYKEKCRIHPKQYDTVFCGACMQRPLCPFCWEADSNQHTTHHPVLHVTRASRKAAVDVSEILELLDISGIKRFIINHKNIVYLNPDGQRPSDDDPRIPTCRTCSRKLGKLSDIPRLSDMDCRFCSIACKVSGKEFHKRSRKGIPRRSPLQ